jgi:hypothetical protein
MSAMPTRNLRTCGCQRFVEIRRRREYLFVDDFDGRFIDGTGIEAPRGMG